MCVCLRERESERERERERNRKRKKCKKETYNNNKNGQNKTNHLCCIASFPFFLSIVFLFSLPVEASSASLRFLKLISGHYMCFLAARYSAITPRGKMLN